jgi:hypothetical protein
MSIAGLSGTAADALVVRDDFENGARLAADGPSQEDLSTPRNVYSRSRTATTSRLIAAR